MATCVRMMRKIHLSLSDDSLSTIWEYNLELNEFIVMAGGFANVTWSTNG
jgi:hypothetical protein